MQLSDSIIQIKGIGEKSAALFHKLNIDTVGQLLFHIPRRFETYETAMLPGQYIKKYGVTQDITSIKGVLRAGSLRTKHTGKYTISTVTINCEGDLVEMRFFNMPYIKNMILPNTNYVFRGILQAEHGIYKMLQPKVYREADYEKLCGTLQPVYTLTKGITNHTVWKAAKNALTNLSMPDDFLSDAEREKLKLTSLNQALYNIHFPKTEEEWMDARNRLVFNEFFFFLYQMKRDDANTKKLPFHNPMLAVAQTKRLIEALPYSLTNAQNMVWQEIEQDLTQSVCMNRLIQGDVGSGKTIIAILSLLMCAANNRQGCLMAPTEVLAKQHFDTILQMCRQYHLTDVKPVLLLGSMSVKKKREIQSGILDGHYNVMIGTQALIQKNVHYQNLSLVITDEQHRFGVRQREMLANKGEEVHVLVMSATPIPRTLAMILYGDLKTSIVNEMPVGRMPIKNCVIEPKLRNKSYQFILDEVKKGRQAYIICPMVESNDNDELENVIDYEEKLKAVFPKEIMISYLHGKMSLKEKSEIMERFLVHEIDILVSTTVIEVGINVPNATVMMVENAGRYGLAQLHQLRGRVGRGKEQSYCIFITTKTDEKTMKRLNVLLESNDGFYIADKDLELRGPGDLFGIRQSGELGFFIGDIYQDSNVLMTANSYVEQLLNYEDDKKVANLTKVMNSLNMNSVDFRTI